MTGAWKGAVTKLVADLGPVLESVLDENFADLPCRAFECDEIWAPIFKKHKGATAADAGEGHGGSWTFTAICADTKLIPMWLVAPRDAASAERFLMDLASRVRGRVQVRTDGHEMYLDAMDTALGANVDYSMLIKIYGAPREGQKRYSPAECIGPRRAGVQGNPKPERVSTSYIERSNLRLRMSRRRYTRLANGHSKKVENHCAAPAIFYNLCRPHESLGPTRTPAMAAGTTDRVWTIADLVRLLERAEAGEAQLSETCHFVTSK